MASIVATALRVRSSRESQRIGDPLRQLDSRRGNGRFKSSRPDQTYLIAANIRRTRGASSEWKPGEASCVGITKSILLVTDGRIGPAFDSTVRTRLRLERPQYSTDWIGALHLIVEDLGAMESRHGPLADAVPQRSHRIAVGRFHVMTLGVRGA